MGSNHLVKSLCGIFVSCFVSVGAMASGSSNPTPVVELQVYNSGIVYVYLLGTVRTGPLPACVAQNGLDNAMGPNAGNYRLVFDSTTAGGRSMLAGLIAANQSGQMMYVDGTGDCGVTGTTESLQNFITV